MVTSIASVIGVANAYPSVVGPNEGVFVSNLMESFAARGLDVAIVAPRVWFGPPRGEELASSGAVRVLRPAYLSCSNRRLPLVRSTLPWTIRRFERAVERAARGLATPDVVYAHFLFPAGSAAGVLSERASAPLVVSVGESRLAYYEQQLAKVAIDRMLRRVAGFLAVSDANRNWLLEHGVPTEAIIVLPNAADIERFRPRDQARARHALGLPPDVPLVAFVGHFNDRKGAARAARALAAVPEARGVFLGSGPEMPVGDQVLHAGPVSHEAVPEWLAAADVFLLPTLAEGSPNAVAEAMASGLPIVSSDIPGVREMVGGDAGILVEPQDVDALAAAVRSLLEDAGRRRAMGEAARRSAEVSGLDIRTERVLTWIGEIVAHWRAEQST